MTPSSTFSEFIKTALKELPTGPLAGLMGQQMQQMVDQVGKAVREVHLTVSWKDGKNVESVDLVTHVVSLGPGSDRNGSALAGSPANAPQQGLRRPDGSAPRGTPTACPANPAAFCDVDGTQLVGATVAPGAPASPGVPGLPTAPSRGQLLPNGTGRVPPLLPSLGGPRGP